VRLLVTGASGFLGSRAAELLAEHHDVVAVARPGGRERALAADVVHLDAGAAAARGLVRGCDAVLHFAGVPDPASAAADPARAVRENAGTTLNLLEACAEHGTGLVYPSTVRAAVEPPPDEYALSKRLGELACELHRARATVVRLTSVFGPGQVAWEGATGAIAAFARRALAGEPIVIPGDPVRTRDFVYVDDAVAAVEQIVAEGRWNETITLASGISTSLVRAAELVVDAAGSRSAIETPGGNLPRGENESYTTAASLPFRSRPLEEAIPAYVDWLRRHPAAQSRTRA
jgi:nucleoside-diphosphate-sugar epimerase